MKLVNPPKIIQLDGLPENVVPISKHVPCDLPNDSVVRVSREQVPVLPNFAMTDYVPQGRTRPYNVVNMNNYRSHQSMYTVHVFQGVPVLMVLFLCKGLIPGKFRVD